MTETPTRRGALQGAAVALATGAGRHAPAEPARLMLRLIGTSDLHANVFPYDYFRDRPDDTVGLAKTATLIARAREEAPNNLLFDDGDILQGTPLGDYCALSMGLKAGDVHPVIGAMNALGYHACTLGNHEFNYGLELLDAALAGANFPAVCCNVFRPDGSNYVKPWLVAEIDARDEAGATHRLKIGIIGFTPPQIVQWDLTHLRGRLTTAGIAETARTEIPKLRAQGVDLVVALCHAGISRKAPEPGEENASLALAAVGGIDAMFTGHQHLVLPGPDFRGVAGVDVAGATLNGVPAFMPGFWGSHLGIIDLDLENRDGVWRVARGRSEARPIYRREAGGAVTALVEADERVLSPARAAHEATLTYVRAPVGEIASAITSYFALVADDPSVRIVNAAQIWYAEKLVAEMPELAGLPILSAAAPFKSGGRGGPDYYTDVPAGPIAIKNVADLYLYPNTLRIVRIDGAAVREWLERSAGVFRRIDPHATSEQALLDPNFAAYNFDVLDGVTYAIDVTQASRYDDDGKLDAPNSHRIVDLRFRGAPIEATQIFLVVTNNYRASGGGHFPGCEGTTIVVEAPDANRDVLVRYIQESRRVETKADGDWRFAPWPKTVVATFLTSPAAAKAPPPVGVKVTRLGSGPGGFERYRVEPA